MTDTNSVPDSTVSAPFTLFPPPVVNPDLTKLEGAAVIVANEADKYLSAKARAKVYSTISLSSTILASASATGIAIAGVIGGSVAVQIVIVSAIIGTVSTAAGAAAARLARANTPVK